MWFIAYLTGTGLADLVTITELVTNYWGDLGIAVNLQIVDRSLYGLRRNNAEFDVTIWITEPSQLTYRTKAGREAVLVNMWAPFWNQWYASGGTTGEQPPPGDARDLIELGEKLLNEPDQAKWIEMGKEFMLNVTENLWIIGTLGLPPRPMIFRNTIMNNYKDIAWTNATAGNFRTRSWQWWLKE